jgi:hypothetical protein
VRRRQQRACIRRSVFENAGNSATWTGADGIATRARCQRLRIRRRNVNAPALASKNAITTSPQGVTVGAGAVVGVLVGVGMGTPSIEVHGRPTGQGASRAVVRVPQEGQFDRHGLVVKHSPNCGQPTLTQPQQWALLLMGVRSTRNANDSATVVARRRPVGVSFDAVLLRGPCPASITPSGLSHRRGSKGTGVKDKMAAVRGLPSIATASAPPHPAPQRERASTHQQQRRGQEAPRRERWCRCGSTHARAQLVRQIAPLERASAWRIATDVIDTEAGSGTLRGGAAHVADGDGGVGGGGHCGGWGVGGREGGRPSRGVRRRVGWVYRLAGIKEGSFAAGGGQTRNGSRAPKQRAHATAADIGEAHWSVGRTRSERLAAAARCSMNGRRKSALTVLVVGRDVQLVCACGFTLTQPAREAIAERCPRCRRRW